MTQGSCWHLVQIRTSNRQVPEWNCTIATVSSQNHTPHNMITVHKNSCSKSAETPTFTTYIVQIPARSCGYFPKCTHACSLIACDDNLLQHRTANSMSIGCRSFFTRESLCVFHVFQHLVQIRAQQDRHFPKMDLHHCNSIQSEQHNIRHDNRERIPLAAKVPKPHAHNAHRADSSKIRRVLSASSRCVALLSRKRPARIPQRSQQ